MSGKLFIISSPSGGGKGTLIKEVLKILTQVGYSVSFTTRSKRDGEENGKDYFFVSSADFEKLIAENEFLEYAKVHGNYYGTSKNQVAQMQAKGFDVILEIDVQGAEIIKNLVPEAVSVFILPPSFEVLKERLVSRGTEKDEQIRLRLGNSRGEVEKFVNFDYVIINDDLETASRDLQAVFLAERLKKERQTDKINAILETFDNYLTAGD